jgi:hypothetical protein
MGSHNTPRSKWVWTRRMGGVKMAHNTIKIDFYTDRDLSNDEAYDLLIDAMQQVDKPMVRGLEKFEVTNVTAEFDNKSISMSV